MERTGNTREQIMEKAAELLMQRGFNGFSYRDISSHLGVKNAAVHYHFPSKSDLALALVKGYQDILKSKTSAFMAFGGQATLQLEGLFQFTQSQFCMGRCICPIGAFSVDFDDLPEEVKVGTRQFTEDSIKWLTRVLEVGREQGEFDFKGIAETRAVAIIALLQGARQLARLKDERLLEGVFDLVRTDLGIKA